MSNTASSSKIASHLNSVRSSIRRITPSEAHSKISQEPEGTVVIIDTRPESFRAEEGAIPGALIIERNVLEWRLDPTSPNSIPEAKAPGFTPIIMCNEGYASSLATASLQQLGVKSALDLDGGFRRWKADGLPTVKVDQVSEEQRRP